MEYLIKLIILIIPVFGFVFYFSQKKKAHFIVPAILYLLALIGASLLNIGRDTHRSYSQPPIWDFLVFWIDGNVAASGENFYLPENYQALPLPYDPGEGFAEEILDVGFKYPPFTMFLFLPLSLFSFSQAYLFWQILILIFCLACIYALWRLFLPEHGILGLALMAALLLRLSQTRDTFKLSQTNFLLMFLFLLFWANRSKPVGGLWLALGIAVKPYMAILVLFPFLNRDWKQLAVAVSTIAGLSIVSAMAFGLDIFTSFFSHPPTNFPTFLYFEPVNQSLLATILRASPEWAQAGSPVINPLFLLIASILAGITIFIMLRDREAVQEEWMLLALLFLGLLVYPATLEHYSVFLIVPAALLLKQNHSTNIKRVTALAIIFIAYLLSGFNGTGYYAFYANGFMWIVCIAHAAGLKPTEGAQSIPTLEKAS